MADELREGKTGHAPYQTDQASRVPRPPGSGSLRLMPACVLYVCQGQGADDQIQSICTHGFRPCDCSVACVSQARRHASRRSTRALSLAWPLRASP